MSTSEKVTAILAKPEDHGFTWESARLEKGTMSWENIPRMRVTDLSKFRATFGDAVVLASLNGTSLRVKNQTIREAIYADSSLSRNVPAMQQWLIESALGITTRRQTVVTVHTESFVALDGSKHETLEQAIARSAEVMAAQVDAQ